MKGTFVDLFCGGCNVGINVDAKTVYVNDQINYIIDIYKYFQSEDIETLIDLIHKRIHELDLSKTNVNGYNTLRNMYNRTGSILDLFILTCFSFYALEYLLM